jgi:hypothetical protein
MYRDDQRAGTAVHPDRGAHVGERGEFDHIVTEAVTQIFD